MSLSFVAPADFDDYIARTDRARARRADRAPPMGGWTDAGFCQWCAREVLFAEDHKRFARRATKRRRSVNHPRVQ